MSEHDLQTSTVASLSKILDLPAGANETWSPEELGAVWRHQLSAPLAADLRRPGSQRQRSPGAGSTAEVTGLTTFADLLFAAHPPLDLLEHTKDFAKAHRKERESALPAEVATLLYYTVLAAALTRCAERITDLGDAALAKGLRWGLGLCWADERTRGLLARALAVLGEDARGE